MMSSSTFDDYSYTFEYNLDDSYSRTTLNNKIRYSNGITQPTYQSYEAYPSHITISLNKPSETWFQYIKRKINHVFRRCFSSKVYSDTHELPIHKK